MKLTTSVQTIKEFSFSSVASLGQMLAGVINHNADALHEAQGHVQGLLDREGDVLRRLDEHEERLMELEGRK